MTPSDFEWCLSFLAKHGKKQFGPDFQIYDIDRPLIYKLLIYFLRDEQEAARLDIDLNKGILLSGPVGCGKTSLMTLMTSIPGPERNFILRSSRSVSFEFMEEGYAIIQRYSSLSYHANKPKTYCFDDLGSERNLKYFGNECNVMGEIILSRYDLFINQGMLTHMTSNLGPDELEECYGDRVRSRLRRQVNKLTFSPETVDKRR
ncbi:P-loop NTPase family protein [Parachryseolinea silvisoli]|jgi:predicted ATPase|uniref:ATPase n=1 Tax=Parachryseolinea silvisoli TaxID=2873601 RepID=UPI002265D200|nr:ATPase [Parachryseolinea silvisoli]MCD9013983.1 ATPase [Parachryseolinea silvisoli]